MAQKISKGKDRFKAGPHGAAELGLVPRQAWEPGPDEALGSLRGWPGGAPAHGPAALFF